MFTVIFPPSFQEEAVSDSVLVACRSMTLLDIECVLEDRLVRIDGVKENPWPIHSMTTKNGSRKILGRSIIMVTLVVVQANNRGVYPWPALVLTMISDKIDKLVTHCDMSPGSHKDPKITKREV